MSSIFWSLPSLLTPDRIQSRWWALDQIVQPVDEPIAIQDVKNHTRISTSFDDTIIAGLIAAARVSVEKDTNRSMLPQTWDFRLQGWPKDRIMIPRAPLRSVDSLNFTDITENESIVDPGIYDVNTSGD